MGEVVREVEEEEVVEGEGEDGRYEERKVTKEEVRKIFWRLKFVDTLNFMRSSLEKLAGNLERDQLKHLGKYFQGERMELMCGKGIYPYEYMTGVKRLRERSLPLKKEFASLLNEGTATTDAIILPSQISEEDYQHAQKIFKTFGCEDLAGYTVLYCNRLQRLPAGARVFDRGRDEKANPQPLEQEKIRSAPQKSPSVPETRNETHQNSPWGCLLREHVFEGIHLQQHRIPKGCGE